MSEAPRQPSGFEPIHSSPPEPSRPMWPLALVVVLIVIAAGVGIWATFGGAPAASPSPTPAALASPSPQSTPPATDPPATDAPATEMPTPGAATPPAGTPTTDVLAQIDAIVAQVPQLRELEARREVPYEFVTREVFQVDLQGLIDEETDPEQMATEERLLKRLGLLPPEINLREAILELYGSQVAAFYRPDTGTFYIIGERMQLAPFDKMVVAHEYTHALQDQHFDLEGSRITDPSQGDAALAQLAAIEGDASLLMLQWGFDNLTQQELASIGDAINPADLELLESMPLILRRQLEFPYNEGLFFTLAVYTQAQRDWSAVDETLVNPPASTAQILHPQKYFDGEQPVSVAISDLVSSLGGGWQRSYEQTMGELNTQVWVGGGEQPRSGMPGLPPIWPHADAAEGWGGDRLAMYENSDGGWAVTWELAWDTPEDAEAFAVRARELQGSLDGESEIVTLGADRVRLLLAHDRATLGSLAEGLGN